ncbi:hypothetical protein SO802_004487 [Lithocarpus litseifolius]|uniref:BHLH domain-containing protein n=1 Tax=Lithocarpus litseifolius TaxID=425828 RepID=A0AAW2E360_9ROSI
MPKESSLPTHQQTPYLESSDHSRIKFRLTVQNLKQLLRQSAADTDRFEEIEQLNRRTFHGLDEARIVDIGSQILKNLLAELLLAREQNPNANLRGLNPPSDLRFELIPLQPLHIADAQLLDPQPPETRVHHRFPNAAVHLNTLPQITGGDHPLCDAPQIVDRIRRHQIDLADTASRSVTRSTAASTISNRISTFSFTFLALLPLLSELQAQIEIQIQILVVDKSTIVNEAVNYIKTLEHTLQTLQNQRIEKLQNRMIVEYEAGGASDEYSEAFSVEEMFKLAVGEINLWLLSR